MHLAKADNEPFILLFPCGKSKEDQVPVQQCHHFPCATFFPLHDRAVSPTQGTEHSFRWVMFPSHNSCCAFHFCSLYSIVLSLVKEVRHPSALGHATAYKRTQSKDPESLWAQYSSLGLVCRTVPGNADSWQMLFGQKAHFCTASLLQ